MSSKDMQIGIGLPANIPGAQRKLLIEWAKKADEGQFSSLGLIDRLVYDNYDPLIAFAATAGITQRIRLTTSILLAPLHSAALLAKQAASLDAISGGRLTLGLGVGQREDDFQAASAPFRRRGKVFDEQLATMQRIWSSEPLSAEVGAIGPAPVQAGGPEILIGGTTPAGIARLGNGGTASLLAVQDPSLQTRVSGLLKPFGALQAEQENHAWLPVPITRWGLTRRRAEPDTCITIMDRSGVRS